MKKPIGSTLPSYKYLLLNESPDGGFGVWGTGGITGKDAWKYANAFIAPINRTVASAVAPQIFRIQGQKASSSYAAAGGDIALEPAPGSVGNVAGNVIIRDRDTTTTGGTWNTPHLVMGIYHLWIDASGRLRIKNSAPTSDTDGTVVGTQT